MQGYWQQPEETAEVLDSDGWLRTGDMACMDKDGHLRIVDRIKDLIIVSGFNVYPNEVEDILVQHPLILEAGVVGEPDPSSGEIVVAHVVLRDPQRSLNLEALRHFASKHLAAYKCPKKLYLVDSLPKSNLGKVLRRQLKPQA